MFSLRLTTSSRRPYVARDSRFRILSDGRGQAILLAASADAIGWTDADSDPQKFQEPKIRVVLLKD